MGGNLAGGSLVASLGLQDDHLEVPQAPVLVTCTWQLSPPLPFASPLHMVCVLMMHGVCACMW